VNFPTLALTFLLSRSQGRFAFEVKGKDVVAGREAQVVAYEERVRPTIVHDDTGRDVPSRGRFWIDPGTGQVLRSVLEHEPNGHDWRAWARIEVDYRREPRLDVLVPDSMRETYGTPNAVRPQAYASSGGAGDFDALNRDAALHIATVARYSRYRQFQVDTQESFRPAAPPAP
jgi:hypothetical protein